MVSKEEVIFTHNWFVKKYLLYKKPLGSIINIEEYSTKYSESDLAQIKERVKTFIYEMYGQFNSNFSDNSKFIAISKFNQDVEDLMNEFEIDYNKFFKSSKRTGGKPLLRIANFFDLEEDSLQIYFEVSSNECIDNPIEDLDLDIDMKGHLKSNLKTDLNEQYIRRGCIIVIFHYDLNKNYKEKIESLPYSNIEERYIVLDGNAMSHLLDIDIDFMKTLVNTTFISNNSKLLFKIKNHPEVILQMGSLIKKWLFKIVSPKKINKK